MKVQHSEVLGEAIGETLIVRYASPNATVFVDEDLGEVQAFDYATLNSVPCTIFDVNNDPVIQELGATEYEREMQMMVNIRRNGDKRQGLIGS